MTSATGNKTRSGTHKVVRFDGESDLQRLVRLNPERYPYLLQSLATGPELSRYDILFACPGETLELAAEQTLSGPHANGESSFLDALDSWWSSVAASSAAPEEIDLPFSGGWFLYLSYELAAEIEPALNLPAVTGQPVAFATRIPAAVIRDHHENTIYIVAEADSANLIELIEEDLNSQLPGGVYTAPAAVNEDSAVEFLTAVARAQEHIRAGDIFQANLSRRWSAKFGEPVDVVSLYEQLGQSNPAPFAGLLVHPEFAVLSSSPERLVKRSGRRIDTRPIAGTRPRNEPPEEASARKQELLQHPKERAEHIMLIDLERNDLGRVCEGGSVVVDEHMVVESYSHVHHIVSNVTGTAREGLMPGELIRAVFPGGTITGCPKVRCMEIIRQLEQRPRGAYTGSMGYLNLNGDCDLNILIRTMSVAGDQVELAAGSGIVADSDPHAELEETRAKAKGLLLALRGTADG